MKRKPVYMLLTYADQTLQHIKRLVRTINGKFDNDQCIKYLQESIGTKNDLYLIDATIITPMLFRTMLRRGR